LGRILSIDYGKRRTGLAVTDPLQIIANGLATVETKNLMDFLKKYLEKENVEKVVIGKPIQPSGAPSENLARVEAFVQRWRKEMPSVPIVYYDERFTSVLAHRAILEGGVKKKTRRENKGLVDEVSATIILQDFMNSQRRI
jgi:putative Holliday junction resolvase